jgi:hypothetical protein
MYYYYYLKLCSYKGQKTFLFINNNKLIIIFDNHLRANVGAQKSCAGNECALMSARKSRRASVVRAKVGMPHLSSNG